MKLLVKVASAKFDKAAKMEQYINYSDILSDPGYFLFLFQFGLFCSLVHFNKRNETAKMIFSNSEGLFGYSSTTLKKTGSKTDHWQSLIMSHHTAVEKTLTKYSFHVLYI